jgi:hypothetical protein
MHTTPKVTSTAHERSRLVLLKIVESEIKVTTTAP